jgi:HAD superfamily hydrolase (TIGR01509 family)
MMAEQTWFVFDLGNVVVKLAYERVLASLCAKAAIDRDVLVELLEDSGGYRDMERGAVTFLDFYDFLCDRAKYRGTLRDFQEVWTDFFDGTMPGIEDLLDKVRERYRVAFLSNSNEIHAEVIPRSFGVLFRREDRFIFSHRLKVAKPDPEIFRRAAEILGALPQHIIFVDDLLENVLAARTVGMTAFQFTDAVSIEKTLRAEGLL